MVSSVLECCEFSPCPKIHVKENAIRRSIFQNTWRMQSEDLFFKIHVKENAIRRSIFPWKTRKYMLCRACGAGQTPTTCYAELTGNLINAFMRLRGKPTRTKDMLCRAPSARHVVQSCLGHTCSGCFSLDSRSGAGISLIHPHQ